ncbi:MAG TPA: type II toxin-antitoxin system RelE/ParE family toxin [Flavobacteriaceae bacterium]|nr:type II toxin-antitoxin system RelE/ParE family toxin [Flavobacteriaceae bacterium]
MHALDESFERIQNNPEQFQKRYHELRIVFTQKFPYGIYYTFEKNTVYVHAVLHTKQNP